MATAATATAEPVSESPDSPPTDTKALARRKKNGDQVDGRGLPVASSPSPLAIFDKLASVKGADISKLEKLLDLDKDWRAEQARMAAANALNRVQQTAPEVLKDARNPHIGNRFAQLETIHRTIKPVYTGEGFSISWSEDESKKEGHMRIIGDLIHTSGHIRRYWLDVPLDGTGAKGGQPGMNVTQAKGSTITYGRRYLETMIFNVTIAGEDVDGNNPVLDPVTAAQIEEVTVLFKKVKKVSDIDWRRFMKSCQVETVDQLTQQGFKIAMGDLNARYAEAAAVAATRAAGPDVG